MESTNEKIIETLQDVVSRLAALETAVAGLTDKEKSQSEGISFEHLGGRKVGHPMPVPAKKEISFESIGGKLVRRASEHPIVQAKPENSHTNEGATVESSSDAKPAEN
jgi:hypothetical protein